MKRFLKDAGAVALTVVGGAVLVAFKLVASLTTVNLLATSGLAIAKACVKNNLEEQKAEATQTYVEYVVSDLKDKKADGVITAEEFEAEKEKAENMTWKDAETQIEVSSYQPAKDKAGIVYNTQSTYDKLDTAFDVIHWTMVAGIGLCAASGVAKAIIKAKED